MVITLIIDDWGQEDSKTLLKDYCKKHMLDMTKVTRTFSDGISVVLIFSVGYKSIFEGPLSYKEYFSFDDNEPISYFYKRALEYLESVEEGMRKAKFQKIYEIPEDDHYPCGCCRCCGCSCPDDEVDEDYFDECDFEPDYNEDY